MPALTILPATGALSLACSACLAPRSEQADAAAALAPFVRREKDFGTGFVWLYTSGLSFGGRPCWLNLCFRDDRLDMATWSVELVTEDGGGMDAELAFMRAELGRQLGRPFKAEERFAWGGIWCGYDPRSDTVSSGVRYR